MPVTASAPGKLVLFGDHAAVYGYPCLVTAVDLRFQVTLESSSGTAIHIETPELVAKGDAYQVESDRLNAHKRQETTFIEAALIQMMKRCPLTQGLRIRSYGPRLTYGLGSSSAITVATIAAYARLFDLDLSNRDIFDNAYQAVLDVQGTGSGVDLAAAVYGGTVYYVRGGEVIAPLEMDTLPIVIGYSGSKVSTTNLIAQVAESRLRLTQFIDPILALIGEISSSAREEIRQQDWLTLGELMNIHQGLLDSLGVTTAALSSLIYASRSAGSFGAKLSGAGGGDCMFALVDDTARPSVETAIEQAGGKVIRVHPNASGVRIEP